MARMHTQKAALLTTLLTALSACVGKEVPLQLSPPTFRAPAHEVLPIGEQGTVMLYHWPAKGDPKGIILGVHGFGDYGELTFHHPAPFWASQGMNVYAYDQRGFGRNSTNADWQGADVLVNDLGTVFNEIRKRHPGERIVTVSHSMGGAVTVAALAEDRIDPEAAVLVAPALWAGQHMNLLYRASAWLAAKISPNKRWSGEGIVRISTTDNIDALREIANDPLYVAPPSSREFLGLIRTMDRAYKAAPEVKTPILMLMGARDEVVPGPPLRAGYQRLGSSKRLVIYKEGWHLLMRDMQRQKVWDDILTYIQDRNSDLPSGEEVR